MKIRFPQYSGKDYIVLGIIILPFTLGLNSVIFGTRYFTESNIFWPTTLGTAAIFSLDFVLCSAIAAFLKKRMPAEQQTNLRLVYMILCMVALSGFFLLTVFHGY